MLLLSPDAAPLAYCFACFALGEVHGLTTDANQGMPLQDVAACHRGLSDNSLLPGLLDAFAVFVPGLTCATIIRSFEVLKQLDFFIDVLGPVICWILSCLVA